MIKHINFIIIFLFSALPSFASWQLPIINFSQKEYHSGTQNWQIDQQQNGWMYFANNYGLLEFDGNQWRTHGINNSTVIRSLTIAPNQDIYVGGSNEFGRFFCNDKGWLNYEPLSLHLQERYKEFGEVWQIHLIDTLLFVQTRDYIFEQAPNKHIVVIKPGARIYTTAKINQTLFIATKKGIYQLNKHLLHRLPGSELLQPYEIRAMVPYQLNSMLIATDVGGLFIYDGNAIKPFHTEADAFLKKNQLYSMAINKTHLAFGTVLNGLVITDLMGQNSRYINYENGLQNNTILSLKFDDCDNLWLGLDNGIAQVQLNTPICHLYGPTNFYGSGYTSLIDGHILYLGTNQGLFTALFPINATERLTKLELVGGSQGQVWNLNKIGNTLFCCHNKGLFEVKNRELKPLITSDGVWNIKPFTSNPNKAIVGTYNGLILLQFNGSDWKTEAPLKGYEQTARKFAIDENDAIWITSAKGLERLTIDNDYTLKSTVMLKHKSPQQQPYNLHVLNGEIYITADTEFYKVNEKSELETEVTLPPLLKGVRNYNVLEMDAYKNLWFIDNNALYVHRYNTVRQEYEHKLEIVWDIPYFNIGGFEHINPIDATHAIVGNVNGFALANAAEQVEKEPKRKVYIREMRDTKNDSLIAGSSYQEIASEIAITYKSNSLQFVCASAFHTDGIDYYSYKLEPMEKEWSAWSTSTKKEYTNLSEGSYTLLVRMKNRDNEISETSLQFTILPPWYHTWWAYLIEVSFLILIIYIIIIKILSHLEEKQLKIEMERKEELAEQEQHFRSQAAEQEREIMNLKNAQLELELKSKSQELAHVQLNRINKNEILNDIKSDLKKVLQDLSEAEPDNAKKKIMLLQNKISHNIEQEVNWTKFEENFDIVNDQFVKRLVERFPWLSKTERKLCIYIKMGLLTKEIAPILKMSVRGVEMLRYRMRKKMDLDRADDLQEYFQSLSNNNEVPHGEE